MHLVHWNKKYDSIGDAIAHADGLAVLGVLFEISEHDNEVLTPIIEGLHSIEHADTEAAIESHALIDLLPDTNDFYR